MKTKYLLLGFSALIAVGGLWFGRAAWRAHQQLVTLNVREVPLADVLRKIERQTWENIRSEKGLDALITLDVKNKPLPYVLDRLAEQAGARWSTFYAVYDSAGALKALDAALRGDGKLEPAGWMQIAPKVPSLQQARPGEIGPSVDHLRPGEGRGRKMFMRQGNTVMEFGPKGRLEVWSPEVLVAQASLSARIGNEPSQAATAEEAAKTAQKVHGKWAAYFTFRKSSMGIGLSGPTSRPGLNPGTRTPNDRFSRLTPQQRVQRARERLELKEK